MAGNPHILTKYVLIKVTSLFGGGCLPQT